MDASGAYFVDVLLAIMALFFIIYLVHGRIRRRSLIGGYKPGVFGYDNFLKLVRSQKYLYTSLAVALFFIVNAIFDARRVLQDPSSDSSILFVAPIGVVVVIILVTLVLSRLLVKHT